MRNTGGRVVAIALAVCVGCARQAPEDAAWRTELEAWRAGKDIFFHTANGPLTPAQQVAFTGLRYFPPDVAWKLAGYLENAAVVDTVRFVTSKRTLEAYLRVGQVRFDRRRRHLALTLYRSTTDATYFLPFTDTTTGHETYGAGRYLDVDVAADGAVALDFNRAYSPYCAYNDGWVCPVAPEENHLAVAVEAGERQFGAGH